MMDPTIWIATGIQWCRARGMRPESASYTSRLQYRADRALWRDLGMRGWSEAEGGQLRGMIIRMIEHEFTEDHRPRALLTALKEGR